MKNILTFDVEDNFTRAELSDPDDWVRYEGQVVDNTRAILDMLQRHDTTATFFLLGKVVERRPELVRMITQAKHEVASHGYAHQKVSLLGKSGFSEDVKLSKSLLESLSGQPVKGFRAMAFSVSMETVWALDLLGEQGLRYDSSMFDTVCKTNLQGVAPHLVRGFTEVPVSTITIAGKQFAIGGGIFFRIVPYWIIKRIIEDQNAKGYPVLLYSHVWEFNKDQPKRNVSFLQKLAQAPVTYTAPRKIESLVQRFRFTSIEDYLGYVD